MQHSEYLLALDAKTGRPILSFGDNGRVNVSADIGGGFVYTWSGAPFVIGDVVVLGGTPGDEFANKEATRSDVRAYDVRTGKLRWVFHVVPQAGELGVETWENESWRYTGHAPVWSRHERAIAELGLVYLPITAPTSDMYGGHRLGDNLFSQSVVAVEAATGKRVWHFQIVHHDLWDYDPPAAPILMDITVNGRPIKASCSSRSRRMRTCSIAPRVSPCGRSSSAPCRQSNVPGERTAPRSRSRPNRHAFDSQGATEDNLIDFTPELRAEALEILKRYTNGPLFTPPSLRDDRPGGKLGTIQLPGSGRRTELDRRRRRSRHRHSLRALGDGAVRRGLGGRRSERDEPALRERLSPWGPAGPRGLPLFKPPYGRITALDMNKGRFFGRSRTAMGLATTPPSRI